MLPMCVPRLRTCALTDGGAPEALMTKRSTSASVYGMTEFQERFNSSTQLEPFQLTIRPVLGAAGSDGVIAGVGGGGAPVAGPPFFGTEGGLVARPQNRGKKAAAASPP